MMYLYESVVALFNCSLPFFTAAPPLSKYSKLLITASCELEKNQGDVSSHFCPGYSDAKDTPYEGEKTEKLKTMAEVFCSHCDLEDVLCNKLFCLPEVMIVNITQTMLQSMCDGIKTEFPSCHSEFCTSPISKRRVRRNVPLAYNINGLFVCKATIAWSLYAGMDDWCQSSCVNGYDGTTCTEEYCDCSQPATTTTASSSGNQPGVCTAWEANSIYSNTAGMDTWCQGVCSGGRCPQTHCQCKVITREETTTPTQTTSTVSPTTSTSPPTTTTETPSTTSTSIPTTSTVPTSTASLTSSTESTSTVSVTTSTSPPMTTTASTTTANEPPFTVSPTTSTLKPQRTTSIKTTAATTLSSSPTPSTTTLLPQSTSVASPVNTNITDDDSFHIVDQIICDHATVQGQNTITARFCQRQTEAANEGSRFSENVIDQVLGFAPKILCSMTSGLARTDSCTNMFCGETPLSQRVIRSALCSLCQSFGEDGISPCLNAYC